MEISTECVKAWLGRHSSLKAEIENDLQRAESLRDKVSSPATSNIDGMPKAPSWDGDRSSSIIARYTDIEARAAEKAKKANAIYSDIDAMINRVQGKYRDRMVYILQLKYLDGLCWNDVLDAMFIGKHDFMENQDLYTRNMFRFHKEAITKLAEYMGEREIQDVIDFYGEMPR